MSQLSANVVHIIVSTRTQNKRKRNTAQSMRDHEKIQKRIQTNGVLPDYISVYLERYFQQRFTASTFLSIANNLISNLNLRIDRLAKRNRQALLCWFAENWNTIHPHLKYFKNHVNYLSKSSDSDSIKDGFDDSDFVAIGNINPMDVSQLLNVH